MCWGGYPEVVLEPNIENKKLILREYAYSYIKKDLFEAGVRDEENFYRLLKILAFQSGDLVNNLELSSRLGISQPSVDNYLYLLQKSFHVSLIRPFFTNPRKELTKMPKVYFNDIGLRNFLLGNFKPWLEREDKGKILETISLRQLLENNFIDEIKFWRNNNDNEVDFIIDSQKAFEVKSNIESIRLNKYKKFFDDYSDLDFQFLSIDNFEESKVENINCINAWDL